MSSSMTSNITSNPSYRRVNTDESSTYSVGGTVVNNNTTSHHTRRSLSDRISDKINAAVWVSVAVVVGYWTNFFHVISNPASSGANRTLLQLSAICVGTNFVLLLYLIIYLPYCKKLKFDSAVWEVYCPSVIPIMTMTGFITCLLLIRATWPVWGFLAPLILGIEAFGFLFSFHFVPAIPFSKDN